MCTKHLPCWWCSLGSSLSILSLFWCLCMNYILSVYGIHVLVCKFSSIRHTVWSGDSLRGWGTRLSEVSHTPPALYPRPPFRPSSPPNTRFSSHLEKKEEGGRLSVKAHYRSLIWQSFFFFFMEITTKTTKSVKVHFWDMETSQIQMCGLWQRRVGMFRIFFLWDPFVWSCAAAFASHSLELLEIFKLHFILWEFH